MARTSYAVWQNSQEELAADKRYAKIRRFQEEQRKWNIHADDRIWPQSPVARQLYIAGTTVFAHFRPFMDTPDDYFWALAEFSCCYRNGLILIAHSPQPHPDETPREHAEANLLEARPD